MAHRENQEERTTEPVDKITEKQFLKELYLFMKKRDTPIERIPNLGFKQSTYYSFYPILWRSFCVSKLLFLMHFTSFMHQKSPSIISATAAKALLYFKELLLILRPPT